MLEMCSQIFWTSVSLPENNKPPVADAGPEKELTLPVDRTTLDGSKSSDDQKIATYHWKQIKSVPQTRAQFTVRRWECTTLEEHLKMFNGRSRSDFRVRLSEILHHIFFYLFLSISSSFRGLEGVKIENADSAVATVTGLEVGTYEFTLTVTDERKLQSSDTVTVIVREG